MRLFCPYSCVDVLHEVDSTNYHLEAADASPVSCALALWTNLQLCQNHRSEILDLLRVFSHINGTHLPVQVGSKHPVVLIRSQQRHWRSDISNGLSTLEYFEQHRKDVDEITEEKSTYVWTASSGSWSTISSSQSVQYF